MQATGVSRLNAVIHERARLGIMSVLAARTVLSFTELKAYLEMTDGNLSVHLISIEKAFVQRKPRTTVKMTRKGKIAFEHYVEVLEEVVKKR